MKWSDISDLRWKDLRKLRNMDRDDLLKRFGLEEHTPTTDFFTGLGLFAVGVMVGAGLGILFAPKTGAEMRSSVGGALRRGTRMAEEYGQHLGSESASVSPGNRIS